MKKLLSLLLGGGALIVLSCQASAQVLCPVDFIYDLSIRKRVGLSLDCERKYVLIYKKGCRVENGPGCIPDKVLDSIKRGDLVFCADVQASTCDWNSILKP